MALSYHKIVAFDLEQCCWNDGRTPNTGEIIEIGVAEFDLIKGEVTRRAQYFVKPDHDAIDPFCTELTGHTARVIHRQGRPLAAVLETLVKKFGGKNKLYIAWGRDADDLRAECVAKGIAFPLGECLNLATLYGIQQLRTNRRGLAMRDAMGQQGLTFEGRPHVGYDDAYNLARLALEVL